MEDDDEQDAQFKGACQPIYVDLFFWADVFISHMEQFF